MAQLVECKTRDQMASSLSLTTGIVAVCVLEQDTLFDA